MNEALLMVLVLGAVGAGVRMMIRYVTEDLVPRSHIHGICHICIGASASWLWITLGMDGQASCFLAGYVGASVLTHLGGVFEKAVTAISLIGKE